MAIRIDRVDAGSEAEALGLAGGDELLSVDGNELTAIYLVSLRDPSFNGNLFVMDSAVNGMPITKVEGTCKNYNTSLVLGDYVRVVEDGAFTEEWGQIINDLYTPACLERLPANLPVKSGITTVYGTTGTYAEQYAKEHGLKFLDMAKTPFVDVPENEWYFPYVHDVYWLGLMNGTTKSTFGPNAAATRAQTWTMLARIAGQDTRRSSTWYEVGQKWAMNLGITDGTNPMGSLTREQLAAMLYRYVGSPAVNGTLTFTDSANVSAWARNAMIWAVQNGILDGVGGNRLNPKGTTTRAQAAAIFMRFSKLINK